MGLALRVSDYIPTPVSATEIPPIPPRPAGGASPDERMLQAARALQHFTEQHERRLESIREGIPRLIQAAEDLRSLPEIDDLLGQLRELESTLSSEWLPQIKRNERERKKALQSSHLLTRGLYADLLRRINSVLTQSLEALRDCRFELTGLAASLDEELSSPVFDDAAELSRFLDSL